MARYFPDFPAFETAAKEAQLVPVYRQLMADHLTPVTAFELLGREAHAFLLESVVGGERIARYSFIAAGPTTVYQVSSGDAQLIDFRTGQTRSFRTADPLADLAKLLPQRKYHRSKDLPACRLPDIITYCLCFESSGKQPAISCRRHGILRLTRRHRHSAPP